jgi:hypothetical protein
MTGVADHHAVEAVSMTNIIELNIGSRVERAPTSAKVDTA